MIIMLPSAPPDLIRPDLPVDNSMPAWVAAVIGALIVLTLGAVIRLMLRRGIRLPRRRPRVNLDAGDQVQAFRHLARRMGLDRQQRDLLLELGHASRVPPVALIMSEHALDTALARHDLHRDPAAADSLDEQAVVTIRRAVFRSPASASA